LGLLLPLKARSDGFRLARWQKVRLPRACLHPLKPRPEELRLGHSQKEEVQMARSEPLKRRAAEFLGERWEPRKSEGLELERSYT
jgi:hypothetical protein